MDGNVCSCSKKPNNKMKHRGGNTNMRNIMSMDTSGDININTSKDIQINISSDFKNN